MWRNKLRILWLIFPQINEKSTATVHGEQPHASSEVYAAKGSSGARDCANGKMRQMLPQTCADKYQHAQHDCGYQIFYLKRKRIFVVASTSLLQSLSIFRTQCSCVHRQTHTSSSRCGCRKPISISIVISICRVF